MNYKRIYNNIIKNRLNNIPIDEYIECHHILPRSLGGTNNKDNLVKLTAREHFICHLLLTKIYVKNSTEWIKMSKAFSMMFMENKTQFRFSNNRWFEYSRKLLRLANSINQSGKNNSNYNHCWIYNEKLKINKSILNAEYNFYEEYGWKKGRVLNWNLYFAKKKYNQVKFSKDECKEIKINFENFCRNKDMKYRSRYEYYMYLWEIYKNNTWIDFLKITGYRYSHPNIVKCFSKIIPDIFIPTNGKKRGIKKE